MSRRLSRDDHDVRSGLDPVLVQTEDLPDRSCQVMPDHAVADFLAHGYPDMDLFILSLLHHHHQKTVGIRPPISIDPLKVPVFFDRRKSLHTSP